MQHLIPPPPAPSSLERPLRRLAGPICLSFGVARACLPPAPLPAQYYRRTGPAKAKEALAHIRSLLEAGECDAGAALLPWGSCTWQAVGARQGGRMQKEAPPHEPALPARLLLT